MTIQFLIKILISSLIIAISSEIAKRSTFMAAILISLPLTSILAIVWTYYESRNTQKVMSLSNDILLMVIPSLLFFIFLPFFLKTGIRFEYALGLSIGATAIAYGIYTIVLRRFGILM
jgi:hypothetical protein